MGTNEVKFNNSPNTKFMNERNLGWAWLNK